MRLAIHFVVIFAFLVNTPFSRTIGILKFDNLTQDTSLAWIGIGIAETVTNKLKHVKNFQLVERTHLEKVMTEIALGQSGVLNEDSAIKTGKVAGAELLVSGNYRQSGKKLKISLKITEVESGKILNTAEVAGRTKEILDLEEKIAFEIVEQLGVSISVDSKKKIKTRQTQSQDAYQWYIKAMYGDPKAKQAHLKKALEFDPNYSYAFEQLKNLERRISGYRKNRDKWQKKQNAKLWEKLIKQPKQAMQTILMLFTPLLTSQKYDEIINAADEIIDLAKDHEPIAQAVDLVYYYKFSAYHAKQDHENAFKEGERFLKNFPQSMYYSTVEMLLKTIIQQKQIMKKADDVNRAGIK